MRLYSPVSIKFGNLTQNALVETGSYILCGSFQQATQGDGLYWAMKAGLTK